MGLWLLQESLRTWDSRGESADLADLLRASAAEPARRTVFDVDDARVPRPRRHARPHRDRRCGVRAARPADPAQTVRCILDCLAVAFRRAVRRRAASLGRDIRVIHVVGGGARNELLCQLTADASGLPVLAGPVEATALGNALVQARAVGALCGGLPDLRRVVAASSDLRPYEPADDGAAWARAEARLWA